MVSLNDVIKDLQTEVSSLKQHVSRLEVKISREAPTQQQQPDEQNRHPSKHQSRHYISHFFRDRKALMRKRTKILKKCNGTVRRQDEVKLQDLEKLILQSHKDEQSYDEAVAVNKIRKDPNFFFRYAKKKHQHNSNSQTSKIVIHPNMVTTVQRNNHKVLSLRLPIITYSERALQHDNTQQHVMPLQHVMTLQHVIILQRVMSLLT